MAKFEVVGDIERNGKSFTVLKGIRATVFSDKNAETKFKDLDGEYFHEGTWFGDDYGINRKFLLWDHGQNDLTNEFAITNPVIGVAEVKSIDAAARWIEVELDKANELYPAIMEINNLGLLGVSSRTLPGKGICVKSADGAIDKWPEVEISFTVTPADPRTRFSDEEIVTLKSVMAKHNITRIEKIAPQEDDAQKDASLYLSINADLDAASIGDIVEAVTDAATDTPETPAITEEYLISMLAGLLETAINPWKAKLDAVEAKMAALEAAKEDHAKSIKAIADSQVALKKDVAKSGAEWLKGLTPGMRDVALDILTKGAPASAATPVQNEQKVIALTPPPIRSAFANGTAPGSR